MISLVNTRSIQNPSLLSQDAPAPCLISKVPLGVRRAMCSHSTRAPASTESSLSAVGVVVPYPVPWVPCCHAVLCFHLCNLSVLPLKKMYLKNRRQWKEINGKWWLNSEKASPVELQNKSPFGIISRVLKRKGDKWLLRVHRMSELEGIWKIRANSSFYTEGSKNWEKSSVFLKSRLWS